MLQQLGECLGKGAFGAVYRAFNWGTGEAVAIKQVRAANLQKSEMKVIMVNLNHNAAPTPGYFWLIPGLNFSSKLTF